MSLLFKTFFSAIFAVIVSLLIPIAHADQGISVEVPATALVWIDASGRITKTITNNGQGFQPGDLLYIFNEQGVILKPEEVTP